MITIVINAKNVGRLAQGSLVSQAADKKVRIKSQMARGS